MLTDIQVEMIGGPLCGKGVRLNIPASGSMRFIYDGVWPYEVVVSSDKARGFYVDQEAEAYALDSNG